MKTLLGSKQLVHTPSSFNCHLHRRVPQSSPQLPTHAARVTATCNSPPTWVLSATDTKQEAPQQVG